MSVRKEEEGGGSRERLGLVCVREEGINYALRRCKLREAGHLGPAPKRSGDCLLRSYKYLVVAVEIHTQQPRELYDVPAAVMPLLVMQRRVDGCTMRCPDAIHRVPSGHHYQVPSPLPAQAAIYPDAIHTAPTWAPLSRALAYSPGRDISNDIHTVPSLRTTITCSRLQFRP